MTPLQKLLRWQADPSLLDDPGYDAPTPETIIKAIEVAKNLDMAFSSCVPDGNGEICFSRFDGQAYESITVSPDGIERTVLKNWLVVEREPL